MLVIAVILEGFAFGALFSLGGLPLGLAILAVTLFVFVLSVLHERRQARLTRSRRPWIYYAINDRLSARAKARRLLSLDRTRSSLDRWLPSGLHAGRFPGSPPRGPGF